ncbi:hypothetical protein [Polaromonas sp.]|uniref:hypothetical protein n=1 Tax=Polaromonas sp. TaxID=1869339 RepID=UPI003CB719B2
MNHSTFAFVHACLALIGIPGCLKKAQKSDFDRSLRVERGVASLPPDRLSQREKETRETTLVRMRFLRKKTFVSLVWVLSALGVAILITGAPRFGEAHIYAIGSICCLSWGTLGRLGWHQGSFSGATIYEELDTIIFWSLYWTGTMFGIAALFGASA